MEDREKLTVNGFLFTSEEDAKLAESEVKKIEYIEQNINFRNTEKVKLLYDKMLDDKQFRTPVGLTYLLNMRKFLIKSGQRVEDVRPVPVYHSYSVSDKPERPQARQRVKVSKSKQETIKNRLTLSVITNVLLAIGVILMFYIALKSETPNMINYRQNIENEYASWEQDLTERENAIRTKERELNIR